MPPLVVPNGGQLRLHWQIGTQVGYNVLGLHIQAGYVVGQASANAAGSVVSSSWATATIAAHIDTSTSITGVGIRDLRIEGAPEFLASGFVALAGTAAGSRSSYMNSLCVTLRTASAGKKFRGRVFLPLDGNAAIDEETATYTQTASDSGNNFITMIRQGLSGNAEFAGKVNLAVVSRSVSISTPVVSNVVRSRVLTTQKRRMPHRG